MGDLIKRFTSFDRMIGTSVIKVLYFLVAIIIILGTLGAMFTALAGIGGNFIGALTGFVTAFFMGVVGLLFWRFMCEIYILFFKMSDDLAAIRAKGE